MANLGTKVFLLVLLAFLTVVQLAFLLGYYCLSPDARASVAADGSGSGVIWLTSCGTEDLGVAVAKVRSAVVYITGRRLSSDTASSAASPVLFAPGSLTGDKMGSGMIFDPAGYILTNHHVVAGTTDIRISIFGEREQTYPCEVVALDPELDLAVIKTNTPFSLPTVILGNSSMLEDADEVLAVGCPFSLEQSVTHGIISDTKRTVTIDGRIYKDLIQTDAAINSGNSGGPLINLNGEVVGINVAIYAPTRVYCGVGFAIPINQAKLLMMKVKYLKGGT
ncbi:MAG: trypsin-like peptidase domain-containing protein [Deltaproteobacteria bacterium]|nr:trypsin-like peptidase domain-containing protein [Deltaproteobacteria bacterium]MBW1794563.1 trypsin-like peptidase domain-containing protein [Deltaproteobacteria bacterium]